MLRDALSERLGTPSVGMSLKQRLITATVLGFSTAALFGVVAQAASDEAPAKPTESTKSSEASDAGLVRTDLTRTLSNDKASRLLKTIVGDEAWTALDSIAAVDPVVPEAEAVVNTVSDDGVDIDELDALVPVHVAAVPYTEASPTGEEIFPSPVANELDGTAALDQAIATVIERPDVRETMNDVKTPGENKAAGDLTSLISAEDFASFLRMLQVAMVDLTAAADVPDGAEAGADVNLDGFNGLFIDAQGHVITVLDDALSARMFRAVTSEGEVFDAKLLALDTDLNLGLLKINGEGPFEHVVLNADAKAIVADMQARANEPRGYLGVSIQSVTLDIAEEVGFDGPKGVLISTVRGETAADKADLRPGDIIMEVNGAEIQHTDDAVRAIGSLPVGSAVNMSVWRDGAVMDVATALTSWPEEETVHPEPVITEGEMADLPIKVWGVTVGAGVEPGVEVVAVDADSEAAQKGLKPGDVILRIAETTITAASDVEAVIEEARAMQRPAVLLLIRGPVRGSEERFVALKLEAER